ncbi:MAG: DUF721 domain-containing protein [Bacillota bacterium]
MRPQIIGDIFREYLDHSRQGTRMRATMALYYWPRIIGRPLSDQIKAVAVRNGVLYVKTENPVLAQEMVLWRTHHLSALQKKLGKGVIREIRISIGSLEKDSPSFVEAEDYGTNDEPKSEKKNPVERLKEAWRRLNERRKKKGWLSCPGCGFLYPPGGAGACYFCRAKREEEKMREILGKIAQAPWVGWEEWRKETGWTREAYNLSRKILLDRWREEIHCYKKRVPSSEEEMKKLRETLMKYLMLAEGGPIVAWPREKVQHLLGRGLFEQCFSSEVIKDVSSSGQ